MRFASRGTANWKCTALANVGVMLKGLRPTGGDGRANTRLSANAEPQRRGSGRSIGRILVWKKTVRIQSETKNLQMQKVPLSYLGTPGPGKPLISSQRTYMAIAPRLALHTLPPELLEAASEWGWSTKEKWQITKIVREVLLSRGLLTI